MTLYIATADWDHAPWIGGFYPVGLPSDWRLAYYANEFAAVVLPPARWRGVDAAQLAQWRADTPPRFRFFCDAAAGEEVPAALPQALAERWGGVLGAGHAIACERWCGPAEPRALRAALERLAATGAGVLVVEGLPPSIEALRAARTLAEMLGL